MFRPSHYVYVDCPTKSQTATERMADELRWKLLAKIFGPFGIVNTEWLANNIDEYSFQNKISIRQMAPAARLTSAPPVQQSPPNTQSDNSHIVEQSVHDARLDKSMSKATRDKTPRATGQVSPTHGAASKTDMYVVDHIIGHVSMRDELQYITCCYGYNAAHDSAEQLENIP